MIIFSQSSTASRLICKEKDAVLHNTQGHYPSKHAVHKKEERKEQPVQLKWMKFIIEKK